MKEIQGPSFVGLRGFRAAGAANESNMSLAQMPHLQRQCTLNAYKAAFVEPKAFAMDEDV
jgi:hypothetical protein